MARVCYLLLCHKDPAQIADLAGLLTHAGDYCVIHYDARAPLADIRQLQENLSANPNVGFANRVKCGWGEWYWYRQR